MSVFVGSERLYSFIKLSRVYFNMFFYYHIFLVACVHKIMLNTRITNTNNIGGQNEQDTIANEY